MGIFTHIYLELLDSSGYSLRISVIRDVFMRSLFFKLSSSSGLPSSRRTSSGNANKERFSRLLWLSWSLAACSPRSEYEGSQDTVYRPPTLEPACVHPQLAAEPGSLSAGPVDPPWCPVRGLMHKVCIEFSGNTCTWGHCPTSTRPPSNALICRGWYNSLWL